MTNEQIVSNLTWDQIKLLDGQMLSTDLTVEKLRSLANDPMVELEPAKALEAYEILSRTLSDFSSDIQQNPEIERKLTGILWVLFWKALSSLPKKERKNALTHNLVSVLREGVDVKVILQRLLRIYEFGSGPDKEERRDMSYALENNEEKLGKEKIVYKNGEQVPPFVKNWLVLYNGFAPLTKQRGVFNQINFLKADKNVGRLTDQEKEIVTQVVYIYDWLLFPSKASPQEEIEQLLLNQSSYMNASSAKLPSGKASKTEPKLPPVVPAPGGQPVAKKVGMAEVSAAAPKKPQAEILSKISGINKLPTVTAENLAAKIEKQKQSAGVKNQEVSSNKRQEHTTVNYIESGAGRNLQPQTPVKAEEYLQHQIDEKLHNLDTRVHKKQS